jgi:methionyl-tRNA formyltransferase
MELSAVCVPTPPAYALSMCHQSVYRSLLAVESLFTETRTDRPRVHFPTNLNREARQHGFKVITPRNGDINHPRFIASLREEVGPTIALSFYCLQKFSPELLAAFAHAVNYHNGFLPMYRGLRATSWSVYLGDKMTGFTFHRMDKSFDEGPILAKGSIPVERGEFTSDLDYKKAVTAAGCLPWVLEKIVAGDPGVPQRGKSSYYSGKELSAITKIPVPANLSLFELRKRLRAFGCLQIRISSGWYEVTQLTQLSAPPNGGDRFCFLTSDGAALTPVRFRFHPYWIYRLISLIRGWIPQDQ